MKANTMHYVAALRGALLLGACVLSPEIVRADQVIYSDQLLSGWASYPMGQADFSNHSPTHSGTNSIRVTAGPSQGVLLYHGGFDLSLFTDFTFWIYSGETNGQELVLLGVADGQPQRIVVLPSLPAHEWKFIQTPIGDLGDFPHPGLQGLAILNGSTNANSTTTFYLDDLALVSKPEVPVPALVHVSISATQAVRTIDARLFGVNTAVWDGSLDTPASVQLLEQAGLTTLRFPGGSTSDEYHWESNRSLSNSWTWSTSFDQFAHVATNIGAQVFITVNYGTGTAQEAADWVRYSNVTRRYGFKLWEIGNENYGSWETDQQSQPHDPWTYATRAVDYFRLMKATDPTVRIGVVVLPGEDVSMVPYTNHSALNPRTGTRHYGWTPVMLSRLRDLGVTPDFLIFHNYGQDPGGESDAGLLRSTRGWASYAADLRQQCLDYLGPDSQQVELVCTEHNSVSSKPGKQTTSLVNALFMADSLGQLMQTEFNGLVWWDLRNGREYGGDNDAALYGWRAYGDYGLVDSSNTPYPAYYAAKLLAQFARGEDEVLPVASDYELLSVYAARRADDSLALLVINKHPASNLVAQVEFNGFAPCGAVSTFAYGKPQDDADRVHPGSGGLETGVITNASDALTHTFPAYSAAVLVYPSSRLAPRLSVPGLPAPGMTNGFQFEVLGAAGQRVILERSGNLSDWEPFATNRLASSRLLLTDSSPGVGGRFYRAHLPR